MKGKHIVLIVIAAIVVLGIFLVGQYISIKNQLVTLDEGVKTAWSQVENVYQRRADLIPNLVETVKGYAAHEKETLEGVTEARAKLGGIVNIDKSVVNNPEMMQKYQQAQAGLGSALQRLMVVAEKYPDLKANQNFMALQDELAGTENRIAVERKRFNEIAQAYNTTIRKIPYSFFSGGFEKASYFEAEKGAESAPKVKF
ncbi:MAG: LemA family protein [Elusimicrobia bacterium RIFOXYB2_FULL_49_7]|nr:MAG: LemA family protein [Elusimicrobia bacterium RIFOXYB2_FULL_49_7]